MAEDKIWSVSEVNSVVRQVIDGAFMPFWLEGEVSTLRPNAKSGHVYFILKDSKAEIRATYFGGLNQISSLNVENGSRVEVFGKLSVYEPRGEYQFNVKAMRPKGLGDLFIRLEELKKKLSAEGLFDESIKKSIPPFPRRIGVITSPDGAAIRDFLQIINRRFPNINIKIYPSPVQGKGSELTLAKGVEFFNRSECADVIILMRGGGSMEDLWPFNEEVLARAISKSQIPVISAVGHEIDFTICDMVADLRVPTPSAAAELVVASQDEFQNFIADAKRRLASAIELMIQKYRTRFHRAAESYVFKEPMHLMRNSQQKLDEIAKRMDNTLKFSLERLQMKLAHSDGRLKALDPTAVLHRGYSVLMEKNSKRVITRPDVAEDTILTALLAEGSIDLKLLKSPSENN